MIGKYTRIPVRSELFFPAGAFLTTPVEPVMVFENGKATERQEVDEATGLRKWTCTVLDADAEAKGPAKSVKVTLLAGVQPVPPAPQNGFPFAAVEFTGMEVKPRAVEFMTGRFKVGYTVFARGIADPADAAAYDTDLVGATAQ